MKWSWRIIVCHAKDNHSRDLFPVRVVFYWILSTTITTIWLLSHKTIVMLLYTIGPFSPYLSPLAQPPLSFSPSLRISGTISYTFCEVKVARRSHWMATGLHTATDINNWQDIYVSWPKYRESLAFSQGLLHKSHFLPKTHLKQSFFQFFLFPFSIFFLFYMFLR